MSIADLLEEWFTERACDGFNIMPPYFSEGLSDIFDLLVPELQRRGLFHAEYEGSTLRDALALDRPKHPARKATVTNS